MVENQASAMPGEKIALQYGGRFAARAASAVFQATTLILLARVAGPQQFGVFAAVTAAGYLLGSITTAGSSVRVLRIGAEARSRQQLLKGSFLTIRLVGSVLIVIVGVATSFVLGMSAPALAAVAMVASDNLGDYAQAYFAGCLRHGVASAFIVHQRLVPLLLVSLSLIEGSISVWTLVVVSAVLTFVLTAIALIVSVRPTRPWAGLGGAGGYWLAALSSNASQLEVPVLASVVDNTAVGRYSIASRLVGPLTILVSALQSIAVPYLATRLGTPGYRRGVNGLLAIAAAYGALLACLSPLGAELLINILGAGYESARSLLVVMFVAAGLSAVAQALQADLVASGLPGRSAVVVVSGVVVGIGWMLVVTSLRGSELLWTCPLFTHGIILCGMAVATAWNRASHAAVPNQRE